MHHLVIIVGVEHLVAIATDFSSNVVNAVEKPKQEGPIYRYNAVKNAK